MTADDAARRRRILHVAADYPTPMLGATPAVSRLLALTRDAVDHTVYAIMRTDWRRGVHAFAFDDDGGADHRAVVYGAPPRGLFMARFLDRLADWIIEDADRRGLRPDVIHAHKLSVDALVGERLARRYGAPLVVSLQGDSDLKIIGFKRDLRARYRRIWRDAAMLFPFAPWTLERLTALLGPRDGPSRLLPCPVAAEATTPPRVVGPRFSAALDLRSAGRKNLGGLISAVGRAGRSVPEIGLDVAGGGDAAAFARLDAHAAAEAPGRVRFFGAVPNERIQAVFNQSCAFALPSFRESFGMVFVEALLAGAPCLVPRGWGIDGYLTDGVATVAVDPRDVDAVADGLVRLARDEAAFKQRLAALIADGALGRFRREAIARVYAEGLAEACAASA